MLSRLNAAIRAVCPLDGSAFLNGVDQAGGVRLDYGPGATAQQQTNAQAVLASFEWSQAAHDVWEDSLEADLADLKQQAQGALDTNSTFLALSNPTNAQNAAQVRALTQQNQRIIKALARLIVRTWR